MSLDESAFRWFYHLLVKRPQQAREKNAFCLESVRRSSEILVSALCECPVEIRDSTAWGGFQGHPQNLKLYLPSNLSFLSDLATQQRYFYWRLLAAVVDWQVAGLPRDDSGVKAVYMQFPFLQESYALLQSQAPERDPWKFWLGEPPALATSAAPASSKESLKTLRQALSKGTEIEGKTKDKAQSVQVSDEQQNPLTHVFEKVMTAEGYQSGHRKMDGSDEMLEHGEALKELTLSHVIRTQQSSESVFKSQSVIEVADLDLLEEDIISDKTYKYPEWFASQNKYKGDWCTVMESAFRQNFPPLAYDKKTSQALRARLESHFNTYEWKRGQSEGAELDLAAAVDRCAQLRAGSVTSEKIYLSRRRVNHDFAIQILVDSSLSTDSYAHGKRIIDTIQESLCIFAEAFSEIEDAISMASFYSHTRNQICYRVLKEFGERWSGVASRIAGLQPEGYTRIGPALRHSQARLEKQRVRQRLVLLLSDGKPTDYDHYEGTHGLNDIRRAVEELHSAGVKVKVLTLSDRKQNHHSFAFGAANSLILKNVKELSESIFHFWYQSVR